MQTLSKCSCRNTSHKAHFELPMFFKHQFKYYLSSLRHNYAFPLYNTVISPLFKNTAFFWFDLIHSLASHLLQSHIPDVENLPVAQLGFKTWIRISGILFILLTGLSSPLASCESPFGVFGGVFWWALIVVLRILHSYPNDFSLPCMYHPSAFQNVGWKQCLRL